MLGRPTSRSEQARRAQALQLGACKEGEGIEEDIAKQLDAALAACTLALDAWEESPGNRATREAAIAALYLASVLITAYSMPRPESPKARLVKQLSQRYQEINRTSSIELPLNPLHVTGRGITSTIAQGFLDLANAARVVADWFERQGRRSDSLEMHRVRSYWLDAAADMVNRDPNSDWPERDRELAEVRIALARDQNATDP